MCGGESARRAARSLWRASGVIAFVLGATALCAGTARSQNATWSTNPGTGDFNTAANWTPAAVPTGTAFFGTSTITNLSFSSSTTIGGWTFNPGASNYVFTDSQPVQVLTFDGAGIVINGGSAMINNTDSNIRFHNISSAGNAAINNNANLDFFDSSSAGNAIITSNSNTSSLAFHNTSTAGNATINGGLTFFDTSTAGNAVITNDVGLNIVFNDSSTAGNATINNFSNLFFLSTAGSATINNGNSALMEFAGDANAGNATIINNANALIEFNNSAAADGATITNNGNLLFNDNGSAGSATIINNAGAVLLFSSNAMAGNATITSSSGLFQFENTSTAGNATITINGGDLDFGGNSTAGNAAITTNSGATTFLEAQSSGGAARFILNGTGKLDMSGLATGGTTAGSIEGDGNVLLGAKSLIVGGNNLSTTFSGVIQDGGLSGGTGGSLTKVGTGTLILGGSDTYTGGTTISGGTLQIGAGSTTGSIVGNVTDNATLAFDRADKITFGGAISGSGAVDQIGTGTLTLSVTNTYQGGTVIDRGTIAVSADGNLGAASGGLAFESGTLQFLSGFTTARSMTLNAGGGTVDTDGNTATLSGVIGGAGGLTKIGGGTLTLTGANTYLGNTTISDGTLALSGTGSIANSSVTDNTIFDISGLTNGGASIESLSGNGIVTLGANALTLSNASGVFSGAIDGTGGLTLAGGTELLIGTSSYTGATDVLGGALDVNGSIATSSLTTISNGALLIGTGTVGNLQVNNGAMFAPGTPGAPGTSMTVAGNLTFQPGAQYFVFLNPTSASFANVNGTASLEGTVDAVFAPGEYILKQYTILQSAGLNGTTFAGVSNSNLPSGFIDSLSYSADDAFLNLTAVLGVGTPLNENQQNVATALNDFFNNGGTLPSGFAGIFNLTGTNLANALTALDGENATGAEHGAFQLMNQFLGLMLDPYVDGRAGGSAAGPLGFAPDEQAGLPPDVTLAYASVFKVPPKQTFAQRWTAWAAGFGGSATAKGDPVIGSHDVTSSTFGYAAGMEYHVSPDTVLGFSLAGGGTNWSLAQGLGTGRSDAFLAGVYGVTHQGPIYLAGALAFANNWFTTNRTALGDQLSANFQGQSYAARLEGGYRFVAPFASNRIGITPYAAIQVQDFHTPAYSEADSMPGGFGLDYAAMTGTDTRSELGGRFDDLTAFYDMPVLLRGRVAWAHDWVSNPALNATFESLPGSTSFTVFGAPIPHDSALASAGAQAFFTPNWSVLAKFDGEFAQGSQTYAGSGTVRYTW